MIPKERAMEGGKSIGNSKIAFFHLRVFCAPAEGVPLELGTDARVTKLRVMELPEGQKRFDDIFIRFDTIPACDRPSDRHVSTAKTALCRASRRMIWYSGV